MNYTVQYLEEAIQILRNLDSERSNACLTSYWRCGLGVGASFFLVWEAAPGMLLMR